MWQHSQQKLLKITYYIIISGVRDDDKNDDIVVVVSEVDSSMYIHSLKLCNIDDAYSIAL